MCIILSIDDDDVCVCYLVMASSSLYIFFLFLIYLHLLPLHGSVSCSLRVVYNVGRKKATKKTINKYNNNNNTNFNL